jgi:hypothetical protein
MSAISVSGNVPCSKLGRCEFPRSENASEQIIEVRDYPAGQRSEAFNFEA